MKRAFQAVVLATNLASLAGCWTTTGVYSTYRPGTTISALVGAPLIKVQGGLADGFSGTPAVVNRELVYEGRRLGMIAFYYREWSENYPRTPMTAEVKFELDRSDVIQFEEMRLQVISATDEGIEVKVLPPVEMTRAERAALPPVLLPVSSNVPRG